MNVPSTDFMALMYIVAPLLHRREPVSSLKRAADALETAKFVDFWQVRPAKGRSQPPSLPSLPRTNPSSGVRCAKYRRSVGRYDGKRDGEAAFERV